VTFSTLLVGQTPGNDKTYNFSGDFFYGPKLYFSL